MLNIFHLKSNELEKVYEKVCPREVKKVIWLHARTVYRLYTYIEVQNDDTIHLAKVVSDTLATPPAAMHIYIYNIHICILKYKNSIHTQSWSTWVCGSAVLFKQLLLGQSLTI